MLAVTKSIVLQGLKGYITSIQVDVSAGMPYFEIVGLPDVSIRESKERVKAAIRNSKIDFMSRRVVINLAPANLRKEGSALDLAIAVGILIAIKEIRNLKLETFLKDTIFIGELSLDGTIEGIKGILPICIEAKRLGIKRVILSYKNSKEAAIVEGIEILPVKNLREVIKFLNKKIEIPQKKM